MYTLQVFLAGQTQCVKRLDIKEAPKVLAAIPALLEEHAGCEVIEVTMGAALLFAVDCQGRRVERRR